jgi:hypothetical protein
VAFKDVLLSGAGSLNHLVMGAGAFVHETVAEADCSVIDNAGLLEGEEGFVTAMGWEKGLGGGRMRQAIVIRRISRICPVLIGVSHGSLQRPRCYFSATQRQV